MKVTEVDLSWLAGIIDGEGTITITFQRENSRKKDDRLVPQVSVCNTDPAIINNIRRILREMNYSFKVSNNLKQNSTKEYFVFECTRASTLKPFLEDILPYLRGQKKHKAELVLDFVTRRLMYKEKGLYTRKAPYCREDYEIANEVRNKPLPTSPETIREMPSCNDIVRPSVKA